jgi:hypothetical protein
MKKKLLQKLEAKLDKLEKKLASLSLVEFQELLRTMWWRPTTARLKRLVRRMPLQVRTKTK